MNVQDVERSMLQSGLLDQDDQRGRLWRLWAYVVALLAANYPPASAEFASESRPIHVENHIVYLPYPNSSVAEVVARSQSRDHIAAVISDVMGYQMDVRTCVIGSPYTYP